MDFSHMHVKEITSTQNALIKHILLLKEKSRERRKTNTFVIEGLRELQLAITAGYEVETIMYYQDLISDNELKAFVNNKTQLIKISKAIFHKLAHRNTTEGIIALAKCRSNSLKDLTFTTKSPLILVAEAPEKPGNIGALLRTADAANLDAVVIANPKSDIYNPNIIRSSVGCVFTNQLATGSTSEIIQFLNKNNIKIYCAALQASDDYHKQDFTQPSAIVVGTEATGLSEEWLQYSTQNIVIPMQGEIDSMNVSVAAGILIFEAKRQRQFR